MSVYTFLEAFAKLEKSLSEGLEGSAATRGQRTIHEVRSKLDKFIKALGPSEIQVCFYVYQRFVHRTKLVQQRFHISPGHALLPQIAPDSISFIRTVVTLKYCGFFDHRL